MQHENADKDPDLRKRSDAEADAALLPPKPKWWQARWVLRVSPLVAFVLLVLAGWAGLSLFNWWAGDGSDGAAAGAWASAFGATALAVASVWLAWQANVQAKEAAKDQEKRHKDELDRADARLSDELEAQRKHQQLMAISPIWVELVALATAYHQVSKVPEEVALDREEMQKEQDFITPEVLKPVQDAMLEWTDATTDFDVACSNALMMVTEEHTAKMVSELYVQFRVVQGEMGKVAAMALTQSTLDVQIARKSLDAKVEELRLKRRAVIRSAREHIVGEEWLDLSIDGVDPFDVGVGDAFKTPASSK
ncbi:hypothetical protein Z045_05815 [Rhodococcus pyridinivorans KG-16]|uniref:Uncharacterized protein n=1 Tax=Rhodococcus pyridinivorans KG-16 TaxID=1441730 RepID=A0A0V9UNV4_9NOCA|nr:hypothetical protein [Rhodococcus pyridinivorans]KSZ59682.1 hypothetical protein Z045_05815 [Rhodococcus pyridinivorans KG-16]